MRKDKCRKCEEFIWVEEHHILPKATFGETEHTVWLCPNCHTDYHQKLGAKNLKNPDPQFHFDFYKKWYAGALGLLLLAGLYWLF